jgi:hypothetical protein
MSQPPAAAQPAELAESQNDFRIEYHTDYRWLQISSRNDNRGSLYASREMVSHMYQ